MFFGAHNPFLGLINIIPQLVVIIAAIVVSLRLRFHRRHGLDAVGNWVVRHLFEFLNSVNELIAAQSSIRCIG